jgi:integrase
MARGKLPIFERLADDGRLMGYQVKIRKQGFPTVTKQFDRLADAERFAIDTLKAMTDRTWTDRREAERTTLAAALERYRTEVTVHKKTAYGETKLLGRLKETRLAEYSLATIQGSDIAQYRDERLAEGAKPNTVRIELALLSHLYTVAASDWGMPLANPLRHARKPKLPPGRDRRLSPELKSVTIDGKDKKLNEEQRLLAACRESKSKWLEPIVRMAIETGMRRGEILGLRWEHVDLERCTAFLPDTKNGDSRTVPLSPAAREVLRGLPRSIDGRVFPLGPDGFVHTFQRATAKAGIADLTFHDLRHEATSRFFERGLDVMQVAAITGHKSLSMLKRYTHLRAEDLAKRLGKKR